jgi:hypothetical protein
MTFHRPGLNFFSLWERPFGYAQDRVGVRALREVSDAENQA